MTSAVQAWLPRFWSEWAGCAAGGDRFPLQCAFSATLMALPATGSDRTWTKTKARRVVSEGLSASLTTS